MAGTTSRQTEEEPNPDVGLLFNFRHIGHRTRGDHCLAGKAFVVPEWGEAHLSLTSIGMLSLGGSNMKARYA